MNAISAAKIFTIGPRSHNAATYLDELNATIGLHLMLFVRVRENWGDDPESYEMWGLDYNAC